MDNVSDRPREVARTIASLVGGRNYQGRPTLEYAEVKTPITVDAGPWSGHLIRRSRKMGKCADRCGFHIPSGVLYLEGDVDPYGAGGFAHDRLCLKCAGVMVEHAVAAAKVSVFGEQSPC